MCDNRTDLFLYCPIGVKMTPRSLTAVESNMRSFLTQTGGKLMGERCLELAIRVSVLVSLTMRNV